LSKKIEIDNVLEQYAGVPVLVLGASGFIGRWVARLLTQAGARLYLPARDCSAAKKTFDEFKVKGELLKFDLLRTEVTQRLIGEINPAITFNLAGYGIDRSERSEELAHALNTELPETLARTLAGLQESTWEGQRFVHVGTAMEYGAVAGDLKESSLARPTSVYGKTKLAGTEAVASVCTETLTPGITARLFGVYGPGESDNRLLPSLISASQQTNPIALTAGLHKRDFTYVEDAAEGLIRLGVSNCRIGEVVNIATGDLTSIRAFVQTSARALGLSAERLEFGALETRPEEMEHDPVNCDRLYELTGWRPTTRVDEGISKTLAFTGSETVLQSGSRVSQSVYRAV
jgi:nucleoside-diphosphate-sugar epimerase